MSTTINEILGDIENFINKVISRLEKDNIDVSNYELDHLCYRVKTQKEYLEFKKKLSKIGSLLTETEINGRLISTYKLKKPIKKNNYKIYLIELPSPKKDKPYPSGLEHVEFVIEEDFEDFMNKYPNIKFNTQAILKPINPDIQIQYEDFSVKFHHKSLEYVIKFEQ